MSRRRHTPEQIITALSNGLATFAAVYLAFRASGWIGVEATYAMFVLAFWAMLSNDRWRIRRARQSRAVPGLPLADDPDLRDSVIRSERWNGIADILGFAAGLVLVPPLPLF